MHTIELNSNEDVITASATVTSDHSSLDTKIGGIFVSCPDISDSSFYTHLTGVEPEYNKSVTEYKRGESLLLTYEQTDSNSSTLMNRYKLVSVNTN